MIGQAEILKANTDAETAVFKQQEAVANFQLAQKKLKQEDRKLDQSEAQILFSKQKQQTDELTAVTQQMANLTKAFGIDGVISPEVANVLRQQTLIIDQVKDEKEGLQ